MTYRPKPAATIGMMRLEIAAAAEPAPLLMTVLMRSMSQVMGAASSIVYLLYPCASRQSWSTAPPLKQGNSPRRYPASLAATHVAESERPASPLQDARTPD